VRTGEIVPPVRGGAGAPALYVADGEFSRRRTFAGEEGMILLRVCLCLHWCASISAASDDDDRERARPPRRTIIARPYVDRPSSISVPEIDPTRTALDLRDEEEGGRSGRKRGEEENDRWVCYRGGSRDDGGLEPWQGGPNSERRRTTRESDGDPLAQQQRGTVLLVVTLVLGLILAAFKIKARLQYSEAPFLASPRTSDGVRPEARVTGFRRRILDRDPVVTRKVG
jgi:hypothetical protein